MNWTIAQLERTVADGGVIIAHWRVSKTDGEFSAGRYGTVALTPDPADAAFVPFDGLTPEIVLAWVLATVDVDAIEVSLDAEIALQQNPVSVAGLPW